MITLDQLKEMMFVEVPGVPEPLLEQHLSLSITRFCAASEAYIDEISVDIVADQEDYTIYPVLSGRIRRINELLISDVVQDNSLYEFDGYETLTLLYPPTSDSAAGMLVKAVTTPDPLNATVPPEFLDRWYEGIRAGALSSLMRIPDRDWSNAELAMENRAVFVRAVNEARIETDTSKYQRGNARRMTIRRDFY
ncbi:MAG: hypothetical protein EOM20_10475 [Spartobacteria bacterium]|nr:hypothetical protein [Spartobacteria bacterium]